MAAPLPVLTYWYPEDVQTTLVVQVGRTCFDWAFIQEKNDETHVLLHGWTSWPYPDAPEDQVRLRCHDHAEAVRVIESLAALRGFTITKRPE